MPVEAGPFYCLSNKQNINYLKKQKPMFVVVIKIFKPKNTNVVFLVCFIYNKQPQHFVMCYCNIKPPKSDLLNRLNRLNLLNRLNVLNWIYSQFNPFNRVNRFNRLSQSDFGGLIL